MAARTNSSGTVCRPVSASSEESPDEEAPPDEDETPDEDERRDEDERPDEDEGPDEEEEEEAEEEDGVEDEGPDRDDLDDEGPGGFLDGADPPPYPEELNPAEKIEGDTGSGTGNPAPSNGENDDDSRAGDFGAISGAGPSTCGGTLAEARIAAFSALRGPITRAARLNTLRVAVS